MSDEGGLAFVDTNLLVYAADPTELERQPIAQQLVNRLMAENRWPVIAVDPPMVRDAVLLARDHVLSFWDALIVVAAARSEAPILYTEDLNDGQVLLGVRLVNPFTAV